MLQAARYLYYPLLLLIYTINWLRSQNVLMRVLSSAAGGFDDDASLKMGAGTPAVHEALLVDGERVAGTCRHIDNTVVAESRYERRLPARLRRTKAELPKQIQSPAVDFLAFRQSNCMPSAETYLREFNRHGYSHWQSHLLLSGVANAKLSELSGAKCIHHLLLRLRRSHGSILIKSCTSDGSAHLRAPLLRSETGSLVKQNGVLVP